MEDQALLLMQILLKILQVIIFLTVVSYIYSAVVLMRLAQKTGTAHPMYAWIPGFNLYLSVKIAKLPDWVAALYLLALIPWVGMFAPGIVTAYIWWHIAQVRNRPGWYGILILIPVVNFVVMGILTWKE